MSEFGTIPPEQHDDPFAADCIEETISAAFAPWAPRSLETHIVRAVASAYVLPPSASAALDRARGRVWAAGMGAQAPARELPHQKQSWPAPADAAHQCAGGPYHTPPRHGPGRRGALAIVAMVLVVALLGVVRASYVPSTHLGKPAARHTATLVPTGTTTPAAWTGVSGLDGSLTPQIAPSDPQIAYEVAVLAASCKGCAAPVPLLRRTGDDGATWQNLPFPPQVNPATAQAAGILVSPAQANIVYLIVLVGPPCAMLLASGSQASSQPPCMQQYISTNGGQAWTGLTLPVPGTFQGAPLGNGPALLGQGHRVYALATTLVWEASGVPPAGRLLVSGDGGIGWQPVDGTLAAQGQAVAGFTAAPGGSTVYAVTQPVNADPIERIPPLELWRSDDAGVHWVRAGTPPYSAFAGMTAATAPAGALAPLYIVGSDTPGTAPLAVSVSLDGGQTWSALAAAGLAATTSNLTGTLATLPDGSVLASLSDGSFFAWNVGASAWREVAPAPPSFRGYVSNAEEAGATVLAIPAGAAGQPAALWLVYQSSTATLVAHVPLT